MSVQVTVDGVACTIERLANGNIQVCYRSPRVGALQASSSGGEVCYQVHPCQRNQYEFWSSHLPANERSAPAAAGEQRPWWSSTGGQRAELNE